MKFVFPLPHLLRLKATVQPWETAVTGADQTRLARAADAMGYDMISVPEHFLIPGWAGWPGSSICSEYPSTSAAAWPTNTWPP